jgi:hypothetical protein
MRDKLRSPGSISTLMVAPPIDSDSDGTGVADGFADVEFNPAAALREHIAVIIATAILRHHRSPNLNKPRSGMEMRTIKVL